MKHEWNWIGSIEPIRTVSDQSLGHAATAEERFRDLSLGAEERVDPDRAWTMVMDRSVDHHPRRLAGGSQPAMGPPQQLQGQLQLGAELGPMLRMDAGQVLGPHVPPGQ